MFASLQAAINLLLSYRLARVQAGGQVLADGTGVNSWLLAHKREHLSVLANVEAGDITAVNGDTTASRVVETLEKTENSTLTTTTRANKGKQTCQRGPQDRDLEAQAG